MKKITLNEEPVDSLYKLSVLLPTIVGREHLFDALNNELERQIDLGCLKDVVQIVPLKDNKEISIGAKRQRLLEMAEGEYVVFIDDDDWVASNYIEKILDNTGSDCVGFQIECTFEGKEKCLASAHLKYKDWGENKENFRFVRSIYHKTPVRRELALQAGFKDMRYAEDYDYSMRVMPLLKSCAYINQVMYYYRYKHEDHNAKYGIT